MHAYCGEMVSGLLALALISVTVQVETQTCTSSTAIQAALVARVDVPVELKVSPLQDGLEVQFLAPGHPPLIRRIRLVPEDCPLVPEMLALMTERFVSALPAHTWAPRAPAAQSPLQIRSSLALTPKDRHHTMSLGLGADGGATLGLTAGDPGFYVRPHVDLSIGANFGISTALGLRVEPSVDLENGGTVRWVSGWGGLSAFARHRWTDYEVRADAGFSAGIAAGSARGFEGAASDQVPLVESMIRGAVGGPRGLFGGLEARVSIAGPRFAEYQAPRVRLGLFFGWRKDIAFF